MTQSTSSEQKYMIFLILFNTSKTCSVGNYDETHTQTELQTQKYVLWYKHNVHMVTELQTHMHTNM